MELIILGVMFLLLQIHLLKMWLKLAKYHFGMEIRMLNKQLLPQAHRGQAGYIRHASIHNLARDMIKWHIYRLRKKLGSTSEGSSYIRNVRGVGYTFGSNEH